MIFVLLFACFFLNRDLVGDSDRPFTPPEEDVSGFDAPEDFGEDGETNDMGEAAETGETSESLFLSVEVNGTDIQVEHLQVLLPCDFEEEEMVIDINQDDFLIQVVYSERTPAECTDDLRYTISMEGTLSGTYTLQAQEEEIRFDY